VLVKTESVRVPDLSLSTYSYLTHGQSETAAAQVELAHARQGRSSGRRSLLIVFHLWEMCGRPPEWRPAAEPGFGRTLPFR